MSYKEWIHGLSKRSEESLDEYKEYKNLFGVSMSDISIRQAIWIVRLEPLVKHVFADEMSQDQDKRFGYPLFASMVYMIAEETCEILNEDFTSLGLDYALASGDLDALARIGALGIIASSKPANCDHECESCRYMRMPGSKTYCMPRPKKEGDK